MQQLALYYLIAGLAISLTMTVKMCMQGEVKDAPTISCLFLAITVAWLPMFIVFLFAVYMIHRAEAKSLREKNNGPVYKPFGWEDSN